jgi:hypothetical protein
VLKENNCRQNGVLALSKVAFCGWGPKYNTPSTGVGGWWGKSRRTDRPTVLHPFLGHAHFLLSLYLVSLYVKQFELDKLNKLPSKYVYLLHQSLCSSNKALAIFIFRERMDELPLQSSLQTML